MNFFFSKTSNVLKVSDFTLTLWYSIKEDRLIFRK